MSEQTATNFNLRWHNHTAYLIRLSAAQKDTPPPSLVEVFRSLGMQSDGKTFSMQTGSNWKQVWDRIYSAITEADKIDMFTAAIAPLEEAHENTERKPLAVIQTLSESLWLGEALIENRVVCYLQTVLNARGQIFGYESFARVRMPDGSIVGG